MSILGFKKSEFVAILIIFAVLGVLMFFNFRVSLRRERDAQRKQDVRDILNDISKYQVEFGYIPTPAQYTDRMLKDPTEGRSYYYRYENEKVFVYAALEGKDEAEYDPKIENMKLPCGNYYCNFMLTFIQVNK